jgi:hypothetical protein
MVLAFGGAKRSCAIGRAGRVSRFERADSFRIRRGNAAITNNGHGRRIQERIDSARAGTHELIASPSPDPRTARAHAGRLPGRDTHDMRGQGDRRLFPFSIRDFESFLLISSRPPPGGGAPTRSLAMCGWSPQAGPPARKPHVWKSSLTSTPLDAPRSTHRRQSSPNILDPFIRTARNGLRSTVRRPDRIRDCSSIFNGQRLSE